MIQINNIGAISARKISEDRIFYRDISVDTLARNRLDVTRVDDGFRDLIIYALIEGRTPMRNPINAPYVPMQRVVEMF